MKKKKNNNKLKLWEKLFITISIISIITISTIYIRRLVYYYKLEHPTVEDNTLATHIIKKGTTSTGDGLYTFDSKEYYYQGKDVPNYLWYSGRLFRIINIDEQGLTLITEDSQTSLVWGINNNIKESYIYNWLNIQEENTGIFLKSIENYENDLVITSWCVGKVEIDNNICTENIESYVNLLSVSDYLKAGGKNSYLNNNTYWWTSNISSNDKPQYVFNTGGINDEVSTDETYYSYGVRPVIKLIRNINYLKGEGTKENPYKIQEKETTNIQDKSIGEYIKYNNYIWRIQYKNNESIKIILDGYLKDNEENIKINYNDIDKYLNNTFYNLLSKDNLNKCNYNIGTYNKETQYNYKNTYNNQINNYVGLPSIGEMFVNDYEDTWLYNPYGTNNLQYKTTNENRIIADVNSNENYIRPVVCLKNNINILSGDGTKNNPYLLEE